MSRVILWVKEPRSPFSRILGRRSETDFVNRKPWTAVIIGVFVVYLATLAPSLTWSHYGADGGDLIAAIARGSLPHPPGFPTYVLLGELFIRIPWGDPAWRLNLMSACASVGAMVFTMAAAKTFQVSETWKVWNPTICAAVALGLTPLLWSQSIITEVYSLATCFAALTILLAVANAPAGLTGLVWGIGLGAHPTVAFVLPVVLWRAWRTNRRLKSTAATAPSQPAQTLRDLVAAISSAALGASIVYGFVIVARASVPSPWGQIDSLDSWWGFVSAQIYRGYVLGVPMDALPQRMLAWLEIAVRQFTPIGAIIAGIGLRDVWRTQRAFAIASIVSVGATSVFAMTYNTIDSMVYLTVALPIAALWLAAGLSQVAARLQNRRRWSAALILALPLLQFALFAGEMDLHADRTAIDWTDAVLARAPANAIAETNRDAHTFALWYAHEVLRERPDLVVIDRDLWKTPPYRKMELETLGLPPADWSIEQLAGLTGRPLVDAETLGDKR
jgi:Protein of unknown function (DUF2723)